MMTRLSAGIHALAGAVVLQALGDCRPRPRGSASTDKSVLTVVEDHYLPREEGRHEPEHHLARHAALRRHLDNAHSGADSSHRVCDLSLSNRQIDRVSGVSQQQNCLPTLLHATSRVRLSPELL